MCRAACAVYQALASLVRITLVEALVGLFTVVGA